MNRSIILVAALLTGACNFQAGGNPPLHHPDLSISKLAKTSDTTSSAFKSYNPNGPVRWNQGWPWKFDLTGIGWDEPTTATAITPRHVLMAAHFMRGTGKTVVFHDRKGRAHKRTIIRSVTFSQAGSSGDVAVGLLDRPLPDTIRCYPLLEPRDDYQEQLVGAQILVTDQSRRLFFHQIQSILETFIRFQYDARLAESKKKRLIPGDSGNPSFILTKGELALIETHSGGGPGSGPFYGNAKVVGMIRKIVSDLDSTYQIRTVGIDRKVRKDAETGRAAMPQAPAHVSVTPTATHTPNPNPSRIPIRSPRPRIVVPAEPKEP